jgi:serine/threonine protein kinase
MGVVHADIKPSNILLRPDIFTSIPLSDGQRMMDTPFTPVFADFTSSFFTTDDVMAVSSAGGGTYDYMAPEQLSRPFPPPDFNADVYALAVSLLELITGQSPFQDAGINRNMKIAMIKEGKVLSWARRSAIGKKRLYAVAQVMIEKCTDVITLLELALVKIPLDRIDAQQWSRLW